MNAQKKIIIIGAGFAGLAASERLIEAGYKPLILESRACAGGRVRTNQQLGVPINCGAGWIHGDDENPIVKLARLVHAELTPISLNEFLIYDRQGHAIPPEIVQAFDEKFDALLQQAKQVAMKADTDLRLSDVLAPLIKAANFSSVEQDILTQKLSYFQGYIGAGYDYLSARYWDLEEQWPGSNNYVNGGYTPMIDYLANKSEIRFNTTVEAINLIKDQVEVVTTNATYYADVVIITLPLGVLKANKVKFNPPLPEAKQHAIQRLGMGLLNVTAIKYPKLFWPADVVFFVLTKLEPHSISTYVNIHRFTGEPVLMCYHGGERSLEIEKLSDDELMQQVMRDLTNQFGSDIPAPLSMITTRWSQDANTYGSYSYVAYEASAADYESMAESVANRLFFAGEATSAKHFATTHGAYLSGIREADKIIEMG